jgi:hypothetical protein
MADRPSRTRSASFWRFSVTLLAAAFAALGVAHVAAAATIWTDSDGDGLPDGSTPFVIPPSTNFTIGLWIDSEGFAWTAFAAYVEWTPGILSYVSAQYVVTGGANFPIDNFTHPTGMGFSGSFFSGNGVTHIGNVILHVNSPFAGCVTPIIDEQNPYRVVSILTDPPAYTLFSSASGSCYGVPGELQACCFQNGSCVDMLNNECSDAGGIPQGSGTSCSTIACPQPQACCFQDGSCVDMLTGQCTYAGGIPQGSGTSCSAIACPLPGACCLPNGNCVNVPLPFCENAGGIFQGEGTECYSTYCPGPTGPCCFYDDGGQGTCVELTFVDCVSQGGSWQSAPGQECEDTDCGPTGACCFPNGNCNGNVTRIRCESRGGVWFEGRTCAEGCATAVQLRSWGSIKALYR